MESTWATSGLDLHLDLDAGRPRRSLEEALRRDVAEGRLASGTRLPSSRALAADLGLARNTVAEAYAQLVAEGWLVARQGSGTTVAERPESRPLVGDAMIEPAKAWRYDLRPGSPDVSSFPRRDWLAASRRALGDAPDAAFGYGDPRGTLELRAAVAAYLSRSRGLRADPSHIVVCSGFSQAFGLLCHALAARGDSTLGVESYGLPLGDRAAAAGLALQPLPVDGEGVNPRDFAGAAAVVVTPAHQFPLGVVLSPRRRADVLAWARANRGIVVEDDYDGEFRYDRDPVGALQGLDPEHVVYAGTASKTLAPALRLAWLVLPSRLLDPVVAAKDLADRHSEVPGQLTLAELINGGQYDRHVRRRRHAYRHRRDRLVRAVAQADPRCRIEGISAGLHALVNLPPGTGESEAVAAAAGRSLALAGLDAYRLGPVDRAPALVVGYATPPDHAYSTAVGRLVATLRELC